MQEGHLDVFDRLYRECTVPAADEWCIVCLLQTNQLCNILGARTNNRIIQNLFSRTIELGVPASSMKADT